MSHQFHLGDLVKHKTGGPTMCVEQLDNKYAVGEIGCRWMAGNIWRREFFKPEELVRDEVFDACVTRAIICVNKLAGLEFEPGTVRALVIAARDYMVSKNDTALLRQDELRQAIKALNIPEDWKR